MHIWKRTSDKFEQILFNKFITTIRLFGITSMMGPNEPTTTAAFHAGIPLVTTLPHASIQIGF